MGYGMLVEKLWGLETHDGDVNGMYIEEHLGKIPRYQADILRGLYLNGKTRETLAEEALVSGRTIEELEVVALGNLRKVF